MKELSLNILDVTQNSISAGATLIRILIEEKDNGHMLLQIVDNGCGMSEETIRHVTDPFYTTRTTRKVGLGIPLLKQTAEMTGGHFSIVSVPKAENAEKCGTTVSAEYDTKHLDFIGLGDIVSSLCVTIQGHPEVDYLFRHTMPQGQVEMDTRQIREILGADISLGSYEIICWIGAYLNEQYQNLKSEEIHP